MKKIFSLSLLLIFTNCLQAQLLATYSFPGFFGITPTVQASNIQFSNFNGTAGWYDNSISNVYQVYNWSGGSTSTIDLSKYLKFEMESENCFRFSLDSITIKLKKSANVGATMNWHLRSNLDNFASDLYSSALSSSFQTFTIPLDNVSFSMLNHQEFRIYLTNMPYGDTYKFAVDDINIYGYETSAGQMVYYYDEDGDGYGGSDTIMACSRPQGYEIYSTDCNDTDYTINQATMWVNDADNDGYVDYSLIETACVSSFTNPVLFDFTFSNSDCDDSDAGINPGIWEDDCPDGIDQNCDGMDGADIMPHCDYYYDNDGDGYGDPGATNNLPCGCGADDFYLNNGYSFDPSDCDDSDSLVNPGAAEIPNNGIDENCDGSDLAGVYINSLFELSVFPNPGTEEVIISAPTIGEWNLQIIDNQGKLILSVKAISNSEGKIELNTSTLEKGIYQLILGNNKSLFRTSWIKI